MAISLRQFHPQTDLHRLIEILNQWNLIPTTEDAFTRETANAPSDVHRVVAVDESGEVQGSAITAGHGNAYTTQIHVDLARRKQGIGSMLYADALAYVQARGVSRWEGSIRDDDPDSLAFARRRRFTMNRHHFRSILQLATFDDARWSEALDMVQRQGIDITTLAVTGISREDLRKLYDLQMQVMTDIPGHDPSQPVRTFEQFCAKVEQRQLPADYRIVAIHGDQWVGMATLTPRITDNKLYLENALTGVRKDYRGRGLAQALKVAAVRSARAHNADCLWTWNDSHNAPILAINQKMGYTALPGTYSLVRHMNEQNALTNELPMTEAYVNVNGVTLWTATQGTGHPFVLCHGGPGGYDDMEPLSLGLAHAATVHRYDQRGCGRSGQVPPYTLETYMQDLDGLRQHWGHRSIVVGGHSWGAGLALAYAIRYPERVSALVYICGTGVRGGWGEEYRQNRWSRLTPEEQQRWLWLRQQLKGGEALDPQQKRELDREYMRLYRYTDFADRRKVPPIPEQALLVNHEVNALLNADWERYLAALTPAALARLTVPVLIVHGEADPRPSWMARELAEMLPNATYVELPAVGHYPFIESPGQLADVVRKFCRGQNLNAGGGSV